MEYEKEFLNWKKRQLVLQRRYADTPPGLSGIQARKEEKRLNAAWEEYEERKRLKLTSVTHIAVEPFAGRREELSKIRSLFQAGAGVVFLSGMGGIGKSALSRAYGRQYGGEYTEILLWSYGKGLEQIFADDGQLGISNLFYTKSAWPSRRQYALEKYRKLKEIAAAEKLLIILDNYDRQNDPWFHMLAELPCDLLVTTRFSAGALAWKGYAVLTVQSLSGREEWREFYRIYAGEEPEGAKRERLEAYRESVLGHTLKMKLALCNPDDILTAEKSSTSILANFRLKKAEMQILCELSFVALPGIPQEVYLSCTKERKESLEVLKSYSLVQEQRDCAGQVLLSLHPVIEEAVRARWHPGMSRCMAFLDSYGYYIRHSWNRPRKEDFWLTPQIFFLLNRLPAPRAWCLYPYECIATYLMEWEYFEEAQRIEFALYECVKARYGEVHQHTAYLAMRIAASYHFQMRYQESRGWYELGYRLYSQAKPVNRAYWADRAEACEKLARLYEYEDGNSEKAFRYVQEALEAAQVFRRDAEETAPKIWADRRMRIQYVYLRRARLYFAQGNTEAAKQDLETALGLYPLNPFQQVEFRTLQIRIDLSLGHYEQALPAALLNVETAVRYQGESIKDTLSCRELLGDVLACLGEKEKAAAEYVRILACLQEKYPHQREWMERLQGKLGNH